MSTNNEEKQLKRCLDKTVKVLQTTIEQLQESTFSESDLTAMNSINNFTLNIEDDQRLDELKIQLEQIFSQHLPTLNSDFRNYVYSVLYEFDYDTERREFRNSLNVGILHPLCRGLQGLSQSIEAFKAAWSGQIPIVRQFIENYPSLKEKPGPWRTTLLYSAAKNNHLDLVQYLIETADCSVNAPNGQDLGKFLSPTKSAGYEYELLAKAASTALHGACYNGHLAIVRYLVEHNADYYCKNQASETPIMNIRDGDTRQYFRRYLLLGYSQIRRDLPEVPISEETRPTVDSIWEYKGLTDQTWVSCSSEEFTELQRSFNTRPFQTEIRLVQSNQIYTFSTIQFLRSSQNPDSEHNLDWLRCRGSSILNFDCYSIWQIMFIRHPESDPTAIPSLNILEFPSVEDSTFHIQTHFWYNCDAKMNERLDHAMDYRQKLIQYHFDSIGGIGLEFNLHAFDFRSKDGAIEGFIRWIPKLISGNEQETMKVLDNFQPMTNLNPIPLTIQRATEENEKKIEKTTMEILSETSTSISSDSGVYTIDDLDDEDAATTMDEGEEESDVEIDDFLEPNQTDNTEISTLKIEVKDDLLVQELLQTCAEQMVQLKALRDREKDRLEQLQNMDELQEDLDTAIEKVATLNSKLETIKREKEQLQKMIKTTQYTHIERSIVFDLFVPKQTFILQQIRNQSKKCNDFLLGKLPKMDFAEQGQYFLIQLTAFDEHHQIFKQILQRLFILTKANQSAIGFYHRHLNRLTRSINKKLFHVKPNSIYWKHFSQIFYRLLKAETIRLDEEFKQAIQLNTQTVCEMIIQDHFVSPWMIVRKFTDQIKAKDLLMKEIERLKYQAFEQFIQLNVSVQQLKLARKPTKQSVDTIQYFLNDMKRTFQQYRGYDQKLFNCIPALLERIIIYFCCFKLQLPLYESSKKLLKDIEESTVVSISTSTGSGKSTLLPALLIAAGYDKVLVTQPRRLPCRLISKRVNETMITDRNQLGLKLAGWAVSGDAENTNAKILYLTDGLFKERLLNDRNLITKKTSIRKAIVFFIDEVHERSTNIDLCLALIARMLTTRKWLIPKIKVIISSATLDPSVPKLFSQIPDVQLREFDMISKDTLYPIRDIKRPNENILDVVKEILEKRERKDQILCFMSSASDVHRCCKLLNQISGKTITAYPLTQSQSPREQEESLEKGSVFFSTNIAETSLTFSSLKYVVDTGMINVTVFRIDGRQVSLTEHPAAHSNIRQRRGRLGRTQPGEYYSLYDNKVPRRDYPIPQISQSDLLSLEFSLRKSPLRIGLDGMKEFLPEKPNHASIFYTTSALETMGILNNERLTTYGEALAKLPDFGSLPMSQCVLAALDNYNCGRAVICLASILGVNNTSYILSRIPARLKSCEGDFMTLVNVMNEILEEKQSVFAHKSNWIRVCQAKGLVSIQHIIWQAFKRYSTLEKSFELSKDYRLKAQHQSKNWESIARALLVGYSQNVFVSQKDLQEHSQRFTRYNDAFKDMAILDWKSTLSRPIKFAPVSIVLARDILYLPDSVLLTAIISFLGEIKTDWIKYRIERVIKLNDVEMNHLRDSNHYSAAQTRFSPENVNIRLGTNLLILSGPAGSVLKAEKHLLQALIMPYSYRLKNKEGLSPENFSRNLERLAKMTKIFKPMICRWKSQKQVTITVNGNSTKKTCAISIQGRDSVVQDVIEEFNSFEYWFQQCAVIRHIDAGVTPRLLRRSMRLKYPKIEDRIGRIADPNRSQIDLYNNVHGNQATRETRMEVVAWICVCKLGCKIEGGFVRDWIVGEFISKPDNIPPKKWVTYEKKGPGKPLPSIREDIVPRDLDCYLPTDAEFDSDQFEDELHKFKINCKIERQGWRYLVLVDEDAPTGPFTMDLIEPHVILTHDRIDFDVNNLVVEKNYTRDLGMRADIQQKPYAIELETIVENIKNKRFQLLRPNDKFVKPRIDKMVQVRGWTLIDKFVNFIPNPDDAYSAVLVLIEKSTTLYETIKHRMRSINPNVQIHSVEEIKNPELEEIYEGMKKVITRESQTKKANERELFHGTSGEAIDGIIKIGFDDRFSEVGHWGRGAYFADQPRKSHSYARPNAENVRVMFFNKVLLGDESIQQETNESFVSAPKGYHSIQGTAFEYTEHIVYRYGQALPYLKITYTVPN